MKRSLVVAAALLTLCLSVPSARADIWVEIGQAGDLPDTAQITSGVNPLDGIRGTLLSPTEVNLYAIKIVDPLHFSASTVGTQGTLKDSYLFLLDQFGHGVYANDDADSSTKRSLLPAGSPLGPQAPGLYYLGIASSGRNPVGGPNNDLIFPDFPFTGVFGPTGPGGGSAITGYKGSGSDSGSYTINLTGAAPAVPEPSSLVLCGLGVACVAVARYRRRKQGNAG
jgi:hypothetical protein